MDASQMPSPEFTQQTVHKDKKRDRKQETKQPITLQKLLEEDPPKKKKKANKKRRNSNAESPFEAQTQLTYNDPD